MEELTNKLDLTEEACRQAAWQYVATYWDQLQRMCLKAACGNEDVADDLMSDEVFRQLPVLVSRWDGTRSFSKYVNSYFYRHLRKCAARKHHKKMDSLDALQSMIGEADYASEVHDISAGLQVKELLERLPPFDRTIVVMVKMYGFTYKEIHEKFNISHGQISKIVNQSLDKMRA